MVLLSHGALQRDRAADAMASKKSQVEHSFPFRLLHHGDIGMWFERFVIIVVSLHRAFLPSGWGMFYPLPSISAFLVGSFGLFFTCFLLLSACCL